MGGGVLRLVALCAGVCASVGAAAQGKAEAGPNAAPLNSTKPAEPSALSRLEALVGQLYSLQSSRAERNEADLAAEPVVILDETSARRSLQQNCICDAYLSGASASSSTLCGKEEAGRTVCRMGNPTCPSDMTLCSAVDSSSSELVESFSPQARSSPAARAPSELAFLDAEAQDNIFVNVNFEVSSAGGLPTADALQERLANMLDVPAKRISLQLVPNPIAASRQAMVQATITTHSANKQAQAQSALVAMHTLTVEAATVDVQRIGFHTGSGALVCDERAERLKGEAFELFSRYLDLKSEELTLLQGLANQASSPTTGCSSCAPVQLFASHMGLSR